MSHDTYGNSGDKTGKVRESREIPNESFDSHASSKPTENKKPLSKQLWFLALVFFAGVAWTT
jgi:hypothetical protein